MEPSEEVAPTLSQVCDPQTAFQLSLRAAATLPSLLDTSLEPEIDSLRQCRGVLLGFIKLKSRSDEAYSAVCSAIMSKRLQGILAAAAMMTNVNRNRNRSTPRSY